VFQTKLGAHLKARTTSGTFLKPLLCERRWASKRQQRTDRHGEVAHWLPAGCLTRATQSYKEDRWTKRSKPIPPFMERTEPRNGHVLLLLGQNRQVVVNYDKLKGVGWGSAVFRSFSVHGGELDQLGEAASQR